MSVGPGLQGSSESSGGSIGRFRGGGCSSAVSQSYVVLPHELVGVNNIVGVRQS